MSLCRAKSVWSASCAYLWLNMLHAPHTCRHSFIYSCSSCSVCQSVCCPFVSVWQFFSCSLSIFIFFFCVFVLLQIKWISMMIWHFMQLHILQFCWFFMQHTNLHYVLQDKSWNSNCSWSFRKPCEHKNRPSVSQSEAKTQQQHSTDS